MKTKILAKEPSFYSKDFKEDLELIISLDQESFDKIISWFQKKQKLSQVLSTDELVGLSREINSSIDEIQRFFRPTTLIAYNAADYKSDTDDLINDLVEDKIIVNEVLINRVRIICKLLFPIVSDKFKKTAPKIPLKYIDDISSKCIFISDLSESFNIENDNPNSYLPKLESLHPAITLKLTFRDKADKPIGMVLSLEDINRLKKWLELSETELRKVSKQVSNNIIVIEEGDKS